MFAVDEIDFIKILPRKEFCKGRYGRKMVFPEKKFFLPGGYKKNPPYPGYDGVL